MNSLPLGFWSHARHGFVPGEDGLAQVTAEVSARFRLQRGLPVMTPGDVTGFDAPRVLRTDPANGAADVSPNYLALVEFDRADLPWLFSPAPQDGRCQPWMMLVVVEPGVGGARLDAGPLGERLWVDAARLPDPTQAWLWAHVQALGAPGDEAQRPARMAGALSRLLCPTRLEPQRRYIACVVPTFQAGVAAGLAQAMTPELRTSLAPAWTAGAGEVTLPVYHRFGFSTGEAGDFEDLVQRLQGGPLPPGIGVRRLRLDHARSALPTPQAPELPMHGALYRPGATLPPAASAGASWLETLRGRLVDAGFDVSLVATETPRVGPPLYGQFPLKARGLSPAEAAAMPPWFAELNLDPRHRVAAGLGTQVVQREQERYMAEAWRQLEQVQRANALRRRGDYAIAASRSLFRRWIGQLDAGTLAATTAPLHKRLRLEQEPLTLAGRLRQSPLPPEIVSVEFRRLTRARGPRGAAFQRLAMDLPALALRAAEAQPLVATLAPDTIGRLDLPSAVWGPARSAQIHAALMPAGGGLGAEAAAAQLDALARPVALRLPGAAAIEAQAASIAPRLDAFLTRNGLVPLAQVTGVLAPPPAPLPPAPPAAPTPGRPPVGPIRPRPPDERLPVGRPPVFPPPAHPPFVPPPVRPPIERVTRPRGAASGAAPSARREVFAMPLRPPLASPGLVADAIGVTRPVDRWDRVGLVERSRPVAGLDRWVDVGPGAHARLPAAELGDTLRRWRDQGVVAVDAQGAVSLDALAVERSARSGVEATTVSGDFAASVIEGRYRPPAAVVQDFRFEAAAREAVAQDAAGLVRAVGERVLRIGDAAMPAARPLAAQFADLTPVLLRELAPERAITKLVNARIEGLSAALAATRDDILAAPELSEPTYEQLAKISQDWILPGIGKLPRETTTLAAAHRAFIASFLVGMNHELGREMLWREYPTDQRGTPMRQFWAHRGGADPAAAHDLRRPLHLSRGVGLDGLVGGGAEDPLVLVVRGEVVRRFPAMIVQAGTTLAAADGRRRMGTPIEPDFFGRLAPDVLLVGFDGLTESAVRAADGNEDTRLWFFFSEHFAEPRFGLDVAPATPRRPPSNWNDASWADVTPAAGLSPSLTPGSSTLSVPKGRDGGDRFTWGVDAASQAWICLQFPFRRGLRATRLLPPRSSA